MKKRLLQEDRLTIRLEPKINAMIESLAAAEHKSKSTVVREMIDKQLVAEGYKKDEDQLYQMILGAVKEVTKPQVERLAAISAKATQIDAAAFFLLVYSCGMQLPATDRHMIDEAAARARKLGIEYLKLKDDDIDGFIRRGTKRVKDE